MLPLSPPAMKWKTSAFSHLLTSCCLDIPIQGQTKKKLHRTKHLSVCCKMQLPEAACLSLGWKSAQTQDTQPQNGSHCPQHLGFNRHPSTYLFLFACCLCCSFFAFFILTTKWPSLFFPSSCSLFLSSFYRLLYFHYKRKNFNYPKATSSHPERQAHYTHAAEVYYSCNVFSSFY